jgi:hypothetical protein
VREDNIRRAQREVGAQTRALDGIEGVEEGDGVGFGVEGRRQQSAVAAVGVAALVVEGARRARFGVVYLLDCGKSWLDAAVYVCVDAGGLPRGCALSTSQIASAFVPMRSMRETKSRLLRSRKMLSSAQWLSS